MAAPLVKTGTPSIYKRGSRYVVKYRVEGKQRYETARTMAEARQLLDSRRAAAASGELFQASRLTFREYAEEWIDRYQGRGRGFRETTRDNYRSSLERHAYPQLGNKRLSAITPRDLANFIDYLMKLDGGTLTDSTIRNQFNPVRACLSTATAEGLIRSNPARDSRLPHRPNPDADDECEVRAFTRAEVEAVLAVVRPDHRVLFELLAVTGLRISEALGLQWKHVELSGSAPHVKVRRAVVRGQINPPKSRHGRRSVPIPHGLVRALRRHQMDAEWHRPDDPVFATRSGTPLSQDNVRSRVLTPALEEADATWAGFHAFRHLCASELFAQGRNVKQVQKWLGHHSPAFTLETYVHLLEDGVGDALDLSKGVTTVQPEQAVTPGNATSQIAA